MTDLKPCPFCGGQAYVGFVSRFPALDNGVFCSECPASIVCSENMDGVIKLWNTRVIRQDVP